MDVLKAARAGMRPKAEDQTPHARERVQEAEHFRESKIWRYARDKVRDAYIEQLRKCPIGDDLQRFRLVEAINVIDFVEQHITKAYSDAEFDLKKVVSRDFREKRGLFR